MPPKNFLSDWQNKKTSLTQGGKPRQIVIIQATKIKAIL
ncbi:hypothetical protein DSOL_0192 [Desulfosporosinus metallidurans]|uniref:Uncharacterized protein n=1 Tax=Desulfosporosinus metallidurans TaxID=1888891 RepID=A0A1Q8R340_9FIRM|nr:hypothetical protein DSOL_0192 [Desulfosporosinus metallidurans]